MLRILSAGALTLALVAANTVPAMAEAMPVGTADSDYGTILVDGDGMTLYAFADGLDCTGDCLTNWPALLAEADVTPTGATGVTGDLDVAERADGTMQVTYNDIPLYYYHEDTAAGDTNGQGVGESWYVVPVGATSYSTARTMSMAAGAEAMADTTATPAATATAATTTTTAPATLPKTGAPGMPMPLVLMLLGMIAAGVGFGYMAVRR